MRHTTAENVGPVAAAGVKLLVLSHLVPGDEPSITEGMWSAGARQQRGAPVLSSVEYIKAGTLRGLAVTTARPSEALPGIPTVGEFLPGFEVGAWHGLVIPRGTSPEIIDGLNTEVGAALADPALRARLTGLGTAVLPPTSPADFGKFIAADTQKWAKVVKLAGINVD
jgi:tripartite-type tricarboxylate transporter receptor subunit TctC